MKFTLFVLVLATIYCEINADIVECVTGIHNSKKTCMQGCKSSSTSTTGDNTDLSECFNDSDMTAKISCFANAVCNASPSTSNSGSSGSRGSGGKGKGGGGGRGGGKGGKRGKGGKGKGGGSDGQADAATKECMQTCKNTTKSAMESCLTQNNCPSISSGSDMRTIMMSAHTVIKTCHGGFDQAKMVERCTCIMTKKGKADKAADICNKRASNRTKRAIDAVEYDLFF